MLPENTPTYIFIITILYILAGLLQPLFYALQIRNIRADNTGLKAYSMSKCLGQLLLRLPVIAFAIWAIDSTAFLLVVWMDFIGRCAELFFAIRSLKLQGVNNVSIMDRLLPLQVRFHSSEALQSELPATDLH